MLLFALVLGLTALATAIAPPPPAPDDDVTTPPPPRPAAAPATTISLPAPPKGSPPRREVAPDAHVVVQVLASEGGQVAIPKLGRIVSVAGGVPAQFDLLGLGQGHYDVLFEPALGTPLRVGTLVSSP
jgi:hypothetical protein